MSLLTILVYLVIVFAAISLVWRVSSRRVSIPCPSWLGWLVELDNPLARTSRAAVIVSHLDLEPGMEVLDFGCGPGRVSLPVARLLEPGGRLVAVDIQPDMLDRVRWKAGAAGLTNIEFTLASVDNSNLDSNRFDRALLVAVLGEIPDREKALRDLFAALKPKGMLSVTETIFDPHYQRRSTVSALATAAGFTEHAVYGNRLAYTLNFTKAGDA